MNDHESASGSDGREFYVPATFQFTTTPGRIERTAARLFRRRGTIAGHPRRTVRVREFYAPATFQFTAEPGRIERFVARAVRQRGAMDGQPRAEQPEHGFYLPGTTRDAFVRGGRRPNAR